MCHLRGLSATLLLALLVAAAVLPLAAARAERHRCHCTVRMICCENGTCRMGGDEPPANGPEWRTCRRESPAAAPLDAFGRALRSSFEGKDRETATRNAELQPTRPRTGAPNPETPPPRVFSF